MTDDLLQRHRAVVPSWVSLYYAEPMEIVRGEGRHVWDGAGRRYLDLFGGILTTMTGHAVPEVVEAIREQAGRVLHTSTLYLIRPMVELAERISQLSGIPDAKVFFTTSGTEATDAALLLATSYRRSNGVLALRNSYHGRSFTAIGVTGNRSWSATSLSPLQVSYVPSGAGFRSPYRALPPADLRRACVEDLREALATTTAGDTACLIAEPVQGVGGFTMPPDGLLGDYERVLDEYGILYVSDEVQTGWGRTGEHFWGYQAHGVTPDLLTFAKGIGNGLALAGVVARGDVMDSLPANSISTFGGTPLACAGGLANLEVLLRDDLQGNARRMGERMLAALKPLEKLDVVGEVRGKGLMLAVETVQAADGYTPDPAAATAVLEGCRARGVLVGKGGLYGNVLRIAPPLSITADEAEEGAAAIASAVEEVSAG